MSSELAGQQSRRVIARESGQGPYGQVCVVRGHVFSADKPEAVGGSDAGPDPFEILMTSLATCTAMTLRMYVQRKELNVGRITVTVEQDRAPEESGVLRRFIEIVPPVCERTSRKLIEIAEKCPIHRTLTLGTKIHTRINEA